MIVAHADHDRGAAYVEAILQVGAPLDRPLVVRIQPERRVHSARITVAPGVEDPMLGAQPDPVERAHLPRELRPALPPRLTRQVEAIVSPGGPEWERRALLYAVGVHAIGHDRVESIVVQVSHGVPACAFARLHALELPVVEIA